MSDPLTNSHQYYFSKIIDDMHQAKNFSFKDCVDYICNSGHNFYVHPLGFYYFKIPIVDNQFFRLHIWSGEESIIQSNDLVIHDHGFSFKSWVLRGKIRNIIYKENPKDNKYHLYRVRYEDENSILIKDEKKIGLERVSDISYQAGECYEVKHGEIHESRFFKDNFAITLLHVYDCSDYIPKLFSLSEENSILKYKRTVADKNLVLKLLSSENV